MQTSNSTLNFQTNCAFRRVEPKTAGSKVEQIVEGQGKGVQTQVKTVDHKDHINDQQEDEDSASVFSISENIKMMLLDDNVSTTAKGSSSTNKASLHKQQTVRSEGNLLRKMTLGLVETLRRCNGRFNYQPVFMNPKRDLTQPSEGVLNNGYDNSESDYILRVSDFIISPEGKEYEILDMLGKGTFGQVVKCECKVTKETAAIKVIKNKKAFKNQGVVEIKILDVLNRVYDPSGDSPLVRMLDFFVFRDHLCIVFELLSASIYDLLKENMFQGLSLNFSRLIISQILDALKVVKDGKLIHCDLKPENILLKSKESPNIKVIDFGSACFEGFAIFQYIQSRYYRSPEILLGLPYDAAIDMWSLGCICAELFLGIPIFPGNSEYDQLSRIIEILGPIPQHMIHRAKYKDKYFYYQPQYGLYKFKSIEEYQHTMQVRLDPPRKYIENFSCLEDLKMLFIAKRQREAATHQSNTSPQQRRVQSLIVQESELNAMDAFIDFLKGVLRIDKDQRWTPQMAMTHPFIARETYIGHFEPRREKEASSGNETTQAEENASDRSFSSKDSKEQKAGSCPSKILYPQSIQVPQYLQQQPQVPIQNQAKAQFQRSSVSKHHPTQQSQTPEFVFYGQANHECHRPPILSIPDEFFKGFMFGRLDQILSMTREQLFQFIYEQKELQFRQHAQRYMMMQQQQQQQHLMLQQQQRIMLMDPQAQQLQQQQYAPQRYLPQNAQAGFPMQPNVLQSHAPLQQFQGYNSHQGNFPGMSQQQQQQQYVGPSEQIIYNPPPYMMQKQQLHMSQDPHYQQMLIQQQQQNRRGGPNHNQGDGGGRGKAGSWHAPNALQAQKYNHYYNQINNPGQVVGRQVAGGGVGYAQAAPQFDQNYQQYFQQQFYPVPLGLQPNLPQNRMPREEDARQHQPNPTLRTQNDQKRMRFGQQTGQIGSSTDSLQSQVIEEEKTGSVRFETGDLMQSSSNTIPYPDNKFIALNYQDQQQNMYRGGGGGGLSQYPKKPSTENLMNQYQVDQQQQYQSGVFRKPFESTPPSQQRQLNFAGQLPQNMMTMIGGQQRTGFQFDQQFQQQQQQQQQQQYQQRSQYPSPRFQGANPGIPPASMQQQQQQFLYSGGQQPTGQMVRNQRQTSNSSLHGLQPQAENNLNTSFSSVNSSNSVSQHPQMGSFLNKIQASSYTVGGVQGPLPVGVGIGDKHIFNQPTQKYHQQQRYGGNYQQNLSVENRAPSVSSSQNSQRKDSHDDTPPFGDGQFDNSNLGGQQAQHQYGTGGGVAAFKYDQPLHRIMKSSLSFEQQIQLKQKQQMQDMNEPGASSRGFNYERQSSQLGSTSIQDEKAQSFSIFENQPSPLKMAQTSSSGSSGQKQHVSQLLKLTARQQSSHSSVNIAKNLTPIDESKFIEEENHHHFGMAKYLQFEDETQDEGLQEEDSLIERPKDEAGCSSSSSSDRYSYKGKQSNQDEEEDQ